MSRTRIVTFDNFRGGEFGDLGASAAPRHTFHGNNVLVYRNGLLGPRPGLKRLTPAGMPVGVVWAFRGLGEKLANAVVVGVGASLYGFTYSPLGAVVNLGAVAATPAVVAQLIQNGILGYCVVLGDKTYQINPGSAVVNALASSPGGRTVAQYGARLIVAGTTANPNRVYYSAADDPTSWPALNYFNVGNTTWAIVHAEESRNRLALANTGQELWILSGVPGVNDSLKRTPRGDLAPSDWFNVARLGESLWFVPFGEDFPVEFTGITDKLAFRHLRFTGGAGNPVAVAALAGSDVVCFVEAGGSGRMMVLNNGVWTYHALGVTTSKLVSPVSVGGISYSQNPLLICDGGAVGVAPKVYLWSPTLDRPGKVSDTLAQPGDDSTTPITATIDLPEWRTDDNSEALVRAVSVDFVKWNTGSASTNHFDIKVVALHRYNQAGTTTSKTQSFDEDPAKTTEDAQRDRRVFRFGDQGVGHGFQIQIRAMRGTAIRGAYAKVELDPARA